MYQHGYSLPVCHVSVFLHCLLVTCREITLTHVQSDKMQIYIYISSTRAIDVCRSHLPTVSRPSQTNGADVQLNLRLCVSFFSCVHTYLQSSARMRLIVAHCKLAPPCGKFQINTYIISNRVSAYTRLQSISCYSSVVLNTGRLCGCSVVVFGSFNMSWHLIHGLPVLVEVACLTTTTHMLLRPHRLRTHAHWSGTLGSSTLRPTPRDRLCIVE